MSKLASVAAAAVLLSGAAVACNAPGATGPVYCSGHRATIVVSAASPSVVSGTSHADVIAVTGGLHEVHGGGGDDIMCSDSLGSTLLGGAGNDTLIGAGGADRLFGGDGNDTLLGGGGPDLLSGGAGTDTVSYADHAVPVKASIDGRWDSGATNERDLIDLTVENITGGSSTNWLTGDSASNVLIGKGDNDRLVGGSGNDVLEGEGGNDTLDGQSGNDTLDGGSGVNGCDLDAADVSTRDCKFDMSSPVVTDFEVLTPTVDITAGQTALQLQAEVTDNLSGVSEVTIQFCDAAGNQDPFPPLSLHLATGTVADGFWTGTLTLSTFTKAGMYSVCMVNVMDNAKNLGDFTDMGLAGSKRLPHGAFGFDVINNRTDTTAPVVSNIVTSSPVDVTNADATVTTDFSVTEAGSGVEYIQFGIRQESTVANPEFHDVEPELITPLTTAASGSGRYRAVVQLPQGSAAGNWQVAIFTRDMAQNYRYYDAPFTVVDRNPITTVPRSLSVARTAGATAYTQTFSVHLTSARAGVDTFELHASGPNNQFAFAYFELTSGTALDGVWTATIQLPDNAGGGEWSAQADGYDTLGRLFSAADPPDWTIS